MQKKSSWRGLFGKEKVEGKEKISQMRFEKLEKLFRNAVERESCSSLIETLKEKESKENVVPEEI